MPPKVLQDHRMSNRPLYMTQSTAWKIAYPEGYSIGGRNMGGKHNLGIEVLKQLPEQLANPLAITNNTAKQQKKGHDSIVIWTDWKTSKGWSVIIPITIDAEGKVGLQNRVETTFDANPNYSEDIKSAGVLYTREGKNIDQLKISRRQLPTTNSDDVFNYIMNPEAEKSKGDNKKDTSLLSERRRQLPTTQQDHVFNHIMNPDAEKSKGNNKKDINQLTTGRRLMPTAHEDDVFNYIMNPEAEKSKGNNKNSDLLQSGASTKSGFNTASSSVATDIVAKLGEKINSDDTQKRQYTLLPSL